MSKFGHIIRLLMLSLLSIQMTNSKVAPNGRTCELAADLVFLLDTSSSIWPKYFNVNVKDFVKDVIRSFYIGSGPQDTRVAVALFSTDVHPEFELNHYHTLEAVDKAVDDIRFQGGNTYTNLALNYASNVMLTPENGARQNVAKLVVVITDGRSDDTRKTRQEARKLKASGADIFAIGVGLKANFTELMAIASSPSGDFAYHVSNYKALDKIKRRFVQRTCQALRTTKPPLTTTTPATTTTTTAAAPSTTASTRTTAAPKTSSAASSPTASTTTTTTSTPSTSSSTTPTTTTTTTTTRPTTATTQTIYNIPFGDDQIDRHMCRGQPADIYFLVDASSPLYRGHFRLRVHRFIRDLVTAYATSSMTSRIGLVTFADDTRHLHAALRNLQSVLRRVSTANVEYLRGGSSQSEAIDFVTRRATWGGEGKKGVPQVIITLTSSESQASLDTVQAVKRARDEGISMFAIGIGKTVEARHLSNMASEPAHHFVFKVNNFKALTFVTQALTLKTCKLVAMAANKGSLDSDLDCSSKPINVMFLFEYLKSTSAAKHVIDSLVWQFQVDAARFAPDTKIGILTQPCIGGEPSLLNLDSTKSLLVDLRSRFYVDYPQLVRKLRKQVFSSVPLTDERVAVLVVDSQTENVQQLKREVRRLKNVRVIVAAVGEVDDAVVESLASWPTKQHVIRVDSYEQLHSTKFSILDTVCEGKKPGRRPLPKIPAV